MIPQTHVATVCAATYQPSSNSTREIHADSGGALSTRLCEVRGALELDRAAPLTAVLVR
ncbi:MAG: hypothetical protein HYU66_09625 [Armatimonadetes bacterium]|nr:hypothetical protein [Armatimonadota bacterium]